MGETRPLRVSLVESYPAEFANDLGLAGKTLGEAAEILRSRRYDLFYQCRTSVLTESERASFTKVRSKMTGGLGVLLDPLTVSFAVKDACDVSGVSYIWLDLDGDGDAGNCAWIESKDHDHVLGLTIGFLERHLEKYVIDAYARSTRESMSRLWNAELEYSGCWLCGSSSMGRRLAKLKDHKLRTWVCPSCNFHVIAPDDILQLLGEYAK
jgi:hypothetical protein